MQSSTAILTFIDNANFGDARIATRLTLVPKFAQGFHSIRISRVHCGTNKSHHKPLP